MKFYVTGRSSDYSKVEDAFKQLKELGHEITFEWTTLPMCKPYEQNVETASKYAKAGIDGVIEADIYIIFVHEDGNGVYSEFGAALAANSINAKPLVYAIGEEKAGAGMFNFHPAVVWFQSLEEIISTI